MEGCRFQFTFFLNVTDKRRFDQLGFTFLHHGTPLCMIIRNYCIFILFFHWVQVQILRMSNF
ncbi:hypothetical protein DEN86_29035, partial [Escherichia coli]